MPSIDANVILRYLTDEPADQAVLVSRLFARAAAGVETLTVDDITLAEVVWTLKSLYRQPSEAIAATLREFLMTDGLICQNRSGLSRTLLLFDEKNIDFADAMLCTRMIDSGESEVYSFDRHFDRVPGIRRLVPG